MEANTNYKDDKTSVSHVDNVAGDTAVPRTAVLQVFKSGIEQSLELVDSMTEEQKLEAWKTVISLFEEKASIGLKDNTTPITLLEPKKGTSRSTTDPTCSPDAIDAGNALLLLTEASQKMQEPSPERKIAVSKASDIIIEEMETALREEVSKFTKDSHASVINITNISKSEAEQQVNRTRENVDPEDESSKRNWKVVILPEKKGLMKVSNTQRTRYLDTSSPRERRSSRLAEKKMSENPLREVYWGIEKSSKVPKQGVNKRIEVSPPKRTRQSTKDIIVQEGLQKESRNNNVQIVTVQRETNVDNKTETGHTNVVHSNKSEKPKMSSETTREAQTQMVKAELEQSKARSYIDTEITIAVQQKSVTGYQSKGQKAENVEAIPSPPHLRQSATVSKEGAEAHVECDGGKRKGSKDENNREKRDEAVTFVIEVESTTETSDAGTKSETVAVDLADVSKDHRQANDLDHAYHSGEKSVEISTEEVNEDITEDDINIPYEKRKKQCPICKAMVLATELKQHQYDHQNVCPSCKKQTSSLGNLIRHVKEVHDCIRPFPCDLCEKGFFKREYLTRHYKSAHDPSVECREERHPCDQCDKDFSTAFALNVHKEKHMIDSDLAEPFACEYCHKTFSYKANLKRHERIHTGDKKHACNVCPKKFIERKSLVNHMYKEHDIAMKGYEKLLRKYECGECHKLYSSAAAIQAHMVTHSGMKPNICLQCGQTFGTKTALRRHEDLHAGIKNWECTYCGKRFAEKGSLQTHTRIHTDERPFKCTECNKSFRQRSTLLNHMPVHKPDRNYLCILCGKSFLRRSHYNFHMKKHNTAPSYKCSSCEAAFYRQTDLIRHEFTHTGLKPYHCNICSKKFTRPTYLRDHMNFHEGIKPYKCKFCDETFHEMGARSRHVKWTHGYADFQDELTQDDNGADNTGNAVYVQAGSQVIKIITQPQTKSESRVLTNEIPPESNLVVNDGETRQQAIEQQKDECVENAMDTETFIVNVQSPEQISEQLHETHVVSKIEQLLTAPKDKEEMNLALRSEETFNAGELLRLVDIDPDYLAEPDEEGVQEIHIQAEIPQGSTKDFVIYVKSNAVNSKGEPVFESFSQEAI